MKGSLTLLLKAITVVKLLVQSEERTELYLIKAVMAMELLEIEYPRQPIIPGEDSTLRETQNLQLHLNR